MSVTRFVNEVNLATQTLGLTACDVDIVARKLISTFKEREDFFRFNDEERYKEGCGQWAYHEGMEVVQVEVVVNNRYITAASKLFIDGKREFRAIIDGYYFAVSVDGLVTSYLTDSHNIVVEDNDGTAAIVRTFVSNLIGYCAPMGA